MEDPETVEGLQFALDCLNNYSATYGDEGYLYIQVDLEDRKQPIIKVRTWQPEPDPKFGLFDMGFW